VAPRAPPKGGGRARREPAPARAGRPLAERIKRAEAEVATAKAAAVGNVAAMAAEVVRETRGRLIGVEVAPAEAASAAAAAMRERA